MPTENLTQFILYVIPGFVSFAIYKAYYPRKDRDTFIEVTNSIIAGIVILSLIKWIDRTAFNYFLYTNTTGLPGVRYSFALIIAGLLTGFLMVMQVKARSCLSRKFKVCKFLTPGFSTVWLKVNDNRDNWAIVYLDDDCKTIYRGWISELTHDPENDHQEFLLSRAARIDENLKVIYTINGLGVYLNLRDVKRIEFYKSIKITD